MRARLTLRTVIGTIAAAILFGHLSACTTGVSVGTSYRSPGWHSNYGRSPFYRCCRTSPPIIIAPGPEPELPIEPPPVAVPLPEIGGGFDSDFGGGFGGDFGGDFAVDF